MLMLMEKYIAILVEYGDHHERLIVQSVIIVFKLWTITVHS